MFARYSFILLLYFTLIFVISEIRDLFDKFTIKSLLTKDLKIILKYRGIKCNSIFEKQEFISLIKETGEVTRSEYDSAKKYHENEGKCNLTSVKIIPYENLFNELVEDSKDSAWILMTMPPKSLVSYSSDHSNKLNDIWCHIQSIYGKYGINMAVLDCERLYNLCWDRGFHRSPFVLVLPRGRVKIKDSVDFFVFPYSTDTLKENLNSAQNKIVEWLRMKIAHRMNQESKISDFPVHFVSIYSNKSLVEQIPTSISAHSVKFTGRIHFWSGTLNSIPNEFKEKINQTFPNWSPPGHFFINNNDLIYRYGIKEGQSINYDALQLFFRDLCPNSSDVFIWILFAINTILSFHIAMKNISISFKLGYFIWYFIIFNMIYCFIFPCLESEVFHDFTQFLSLIWQKIVICSFFEHLRYLQFNQKLNFHLCTVVWMLLIFIIVYRCKEPEQPEMISTSEALHNNRNVEPWDRDVEPLDRDVEPSDRDVEPLDPDVEPLDPDVESLDPDVEPLDPDVESLDPDVEPLDPDVESLDPDVEPLDPDVELDLEAGQRITFFTSLGRTYFFLHQQPPLYLEKLFNWTFQVVNEINTFRDEYSTDEHNSSSTSNSPTIIPESHNKESQWPPGYIFTKECSICLGNFQQNEMLCGLPCGHVFHDCCIKKWLVEKDDCPHCRWPAYKEKP